LNHYLIRLLTSIKTMLLPLNKKIPIYIPVYHNDLLKDRTALITGGTSGIGFAIADRFLDSGATVIITGRDKSRLDHACKELLKKHPYASIDRIFGVVMDVTDMKSIKKGWEEILKLTDKKIDILVNNAGVLSQVGFFDIRESIDEEDFTRVMDTNVKGLYFLSRLVANYMIENRIHGNILNIASSSSLRPAITPYSISKWALRGFTLGLAKSLIKYGIVVNGLAPGPTATPMLTKDTAVLNHPTSPSKRYADPLEIANMAVILVSSLSRMIVGDIVYMTGGCGTITFDDIPY